MNKTGWRADLILGKNDIPKAQFANAVTALRGAYASLIAFDVFAHQTMLMEVPPWRPLIDAADFQPRPWDDDLAATHWLQTKWGIAVTPARSATPSSWWRGIANIILCKIICAASNMTARPGWTRCCRRISAPNKHRIRPPLGGT
jgi:hypothetical protein